MGQLVGNRKRLGEQTARDIDGKCNENRLRYQPDR
jgi:hypothetical protein